jgi:hypothetical protein
MTSTMDKIVFALLKAQVCTLVTLVIQFCAPLITPLIFMIFSMFRVLLRVYYLFIDLHLIIMSLLNSILSSF